MYLSSLISKMKSISWHTYAHSHPNSGPKWTRKSPKRHCFLLKNVPFEVFLRWRRSLLCQLLVYILTIYAKHLLFRFWSGGILMLIAILTGVHTYAYCHPYRGSKWTHNSLKKQSDFAKKHCFWGFMSEMKVTCMPNICLIFWLFILNSFFFSF